MQILSLESHMDSRTLHTWHTIITTCSGNTTTCSPIGVHHCQRTRSYLCKTRICNVSQLVPLFLVTVKTLDHGPFHTQLYPHHTNMNQSQNHGAQPVIQRRLQHYLYKKVEVTEFYLQMADFWTIALGSAHFWYYVLYLFNMQPSILTKPFDQHVSVFFFSVYNN